MIRTLGLAIALAMLAAPAQAHWHKAESEHFVIYADTSESSLNRFAEVLERYNAAMELILSYDSETPSPSNRVTIFVVGSQRSVSKLKGDDAPQVAGFYVPRAGASRAFVQRLTGNYTKPDFSLTVLLHEYAHHFLISNMRHAMPVWLSEGAAEFFASARFDRDGGVQIAMPAYHRAAELAYARDVTVEELLDHNLYEKNHPKGFDSFYGRAWALYHYLYFDEARRGQLVAYWKAISDGVPEHTAALQSFGDLKKLDKDLDAYLRKRRINSLKIASEHIQIAPVTVSMLSDGMDAVLPLIIRSQRGVDTEQALDVVNRVREVAARYPDDPGVLSELAEAEHDAGNDDASIAAADRALAINPQAKNALIQKGLSLFRKAAKASDKTLAYKQAMEPFAALNHLENNHPLPLIYYYRSYTDQGKNPPEMARKALDRALQLAPFDRDLAMQVALMDADEGKIALARYHLEPVAANPHGGKLADLAKAYRSQLAAIKEGTRWHPDLLGQTSEEVTQDPAVPPKTGD